MSKSQSYGPGGCLFGLVLGVGIVLGAIVGPCESKPKRSDNEPGIIERVDNAASGWIKRNLKEAADEYVDEKVDSLKERISGDGDEE